MNRTRFLTNDLSQASALVIDGSSNTRSIMIAQLRELGVRTIQQTSRTSDARKYLESGTYDIVLCEQHFPYDRMTGQDLLDDLRRAGMLPFATIFIMVTAEASYTKVVEAAESMLDSYLLKPFTAARLLDRISSARKRKVALQDIYQAVEDQEFTHAARLCLLRFNEKSDYWMYAGRVGAELLLRLGHFDKAQKIYEIVAAADPQPWARLGVARVLLDTGQPQKARPVLEALLQDEPAYADAYDNLARALMELGDFDGAMLAYEEATRLTPASIGRLQRQGMLAFYLGDRATAAEMLDSTVRLGLGSKLFDGQTLMLLGFLQAEVADRKQFQAYAQDLRRMSERNPESVRLRRMVQTMQVLECSLNQGPEETGAALQVLVQDMLAPNFDFEAGCNLLSVLAWLSEKHREPPQADRIVQTLGLRFATSKAMAQLLIGAAKQNPRYSEMINESNLKVLRLLEQALAPSLQGDPTTTVETLMAEGTATLNAKIIETAWLVLKRFEPKIPKAAELAQQIQPWRDTLGTAYNKPALGDRNLRQSGGVSLRGMDTPPVQPTLAPSMPVAA